MEARIGDAKEVICKAAKKYNPDLLVVGSHGSGVLKRYCWRNSPLFATLRSAYAKQNKQCYSYAWFGMIHVIIDPEYCQFSFQVSIGFLFFNTTLVLSKGYWILQGLPWQFKWLLCHPSTVPCCCRKAPEEQGSLIFSSLMPCLCSESSYAGWP